MSNEYGIWLVYRKAGDNPNNIFFVCEAVYEGTEEQVKELLTSEDQKIFKLPPVTFIDGSEEILPQKTIALPVNPSNKGNPCNPPSGKYEVFIKRDFDGDYVVSINRDDGSPLHRGLKDYYRTMRRAKRAAERAVKRDRETNQVLAESPITYNL